jgi:hypothetical protein
MALAVTNHQRPVPRREFQKKREVLAPSALPSRSRTCAMKPQRASPGQCPTKPHCNPASYRDRCYRRASSARHRSARAASGREADLQGVQGVR